MSRFVLCAVAGLFLYALNTELRLTTGGLAASGYFSFAWITACAWIFWPGR